MRSLRQNMCRLAIFLTFIPLAYVGTHALEGVEDASAQEVYCTGLGCLLSTSTSTTSTALTVGGVLLLMRPRNQPTAHLALYLEHNRLAVTESLSVGGGQAVEDLANILFEERAAEYEHLLGRALRAQRAQLLGLLDGPVSVGDASAFLSTVRMELAARSVPWPVR